MDSDGMDYLNGDLARLAHHIPKRLAGEALQSKYQETRTQVNLGPGFLVFALVEIGGFEPPQTEPKSVVLPLHHISIPTAKIVKFFLFPSFIWIYQQLRVVITPVV